MALSLPVCGRLWYWTLVLCTLGQSHLGRMRQDAAAYGTKVQYSKPVAAGKRLAMNSSFLAAIGVTYRAAEIRGAPAPGQSSGQGFSAIEAETALH